MIWWTDATPTGQLADLLRLPAPQRPIEIEAMWARDLANMLRTTRLTYPSGHNHWRGPADGTFGDVAVVPLVTAFIAAEIDANRAVTLDRIHQRLVIARGAMRLDLPAELVEIRARKLTIDAAAELLCSARLCDQSLTDGGRYELHADVAHKVDLVVRFAVAGPRAVQIKRGYAPPPLVPGVRLAVTPRTGEWLGPALVATAALVSSFVASTDRLERDTA